MPEANEKCFMIRQRALPNAASSIEAVEIHTLISFSTRQVEFQFSPCTNC